jgi:hypothetical protein
MWIQLKWSEEQDIGLCAMTLQGRPWAEIARAVGHSRWSTIERARRLGVAWGRPRPVKKVASSARDAERDCLPAGHPTTWGLLTVGTVLEGSPFNALAPVIAGGGDVPS